MPVVGIDLGRHGGFAQLGKKTPRILRLDTTDPAAVHGMLRAVPCGTLVVAERLICPPWMPRRAVGMLHGGLGVVRGVCHVLGLRLELVSPNVWQVALFGVAPPKSRKIKHARGSTRKKSFVLAARDAVPGGDFPQAWGTADAYWLARYGQTAFL